MPLFRLGRLSNSLLFLTIVLIPLLGHAIATVMILTDEYAPAERIFWLAEVWTLFPIVGPLVYLLFGQRRYRVLPGRAG